MSKWGASEILALLGVVATIVVAMVGPVRRAIGRAWRGALLRAGRPERRYAAWFVRTWGVYDNPYLDDKEDLDLTRTFVSLSFHEPEGDREVRAVATEVLADRAAGNMVIEGEPGSGKSTLLKAYGVGALRARHWLRGRRPGRAEVPFLVPLRKLARYLGRGGGLADFLVDDILVSDCGMTRADAVRLLAYLLERQRVLVMLDGLDEVTADRYDAVLEAVHRFLRDHDRERPTHLARVVVTCRRQNFRMIEDEWVPAIARRVCTLAPLRDSEIFSYLNALRPKFKAASGPESFLQAVRASGTLDLHRTPLVLAMSVGLYARKDYYEIPSSIAKLYQTMIEEMLDRHRFKRDPGGGALRFPVGDKYRLLREFALATARSPAGFDEFDRRALVDFATALAPDLDAPPEPRALVDEVIGRSGLLTDVTETGRFVFAHRSIQEHLAAEELRKLPDGADLLLDKAADSQWRQVVLFYAAGLDQRAANEFLPRLADRSFAAHCLGRARASDDVAADILDSLRPDARDRDLSALVAAAMSPRATVQEMAVQRLEKTITDPNASLAALSGDIDGVLPLLNALAGTNAARIAALVPRVIDRIPDDPRLVEPLWRCLTAPGIDRLPAAKTLVARLLELVMEPDGKAALDRQERYDRPFLTAAVRQKAYPFKEGLPLDSNLVTLLAWAEYLEVAPDTLNRFYQAKAEGRLARVEVDRSRTVTVSLFWPARVVNAVGAVAALAGTVNVAVFEWRALIRPFGWWSPLLHLAPAVAAFGLAIGIILWGEKGREGSWRRYLDEADTKVRSGHAVSTAAERFPNAFLIVFVILLVPLAYAVAAAPLATWSLTGFLVLATAMPFFVYWVPFLALFSEGTRLHLYRPNPYIDMYDDPRSRHWLR
ncbi:NACHT domain-containing protein [Phytohabitans sp. LJ34]|uniref:NACHT domain-containing protein n=1 Tax=Phytohabitans sp. LJ34 TaxID=3452217 RepID=UPI003F88800F